MTSQVETIQNMTMAIWPVVLGSLTFIDVKADAGSDMTYLVDYGTTDLEETFVSLSGDLQNYNKTYPDIGTYEVTVTLTNEKSSVSMVAYAEVDINMTDVIIQTNHTDYPAPAWMNVSCTTGSRITVFWMMDDGYALEHFAANCSTLQYLEYNMPGKGFYETEVRVSNSLWYSYESFILAAVVGVTNYVLNVPTAQNHTNAVVWARTLDTGSNLTCILDYGDGNIALIHEQIPATSHDFSYVYANTGVYHWTLTCSNLLTEFVDENDVTIEVPIADFSTTTSIIFLHGGDLQLDWTITAGTNVTFNVTFNLANESAQSVPTNQINYTFGALSGNVILTESDYTAGDWIAVIKGFNVVSCVEATVSIIIDKLITGLTVESDYLHQKVGEQITLTIGTTDGSRQEYYIDWGDGAIHVSAGPTASLAGPSQYICNTSYSQPAYLSVTVTVNNSVGFIVNTLDIGIEYPVDGTTVTFSNVSRPTIGVGFTLNSPANPATSAMAVLDFDHDGDTWTEDLNETATNEFLHFFPYYQVYAMTITLSNNVSNLTLSPYVMVGVYISTPAIQLPYPNYCVRPTPPSGLGLPLTEAEFNVSVEAGSNVEYQVDFGDTNSSPWTPRAETTDWTGPDSIIIKHNYTSAGDYTATLSLRNNFTDTPETAGSVNVNVEDPVAGFTWAPMATQNLNHTSNTWFALTQDSAYLFPTDANCEFMYDDGGSDETVPMTESGVAQVFNHSHLYNIPHGPRQPYINCTNCVSWQNFTQTVMFHKAINDLSARTTNTTVEVAASADVLVTTSWGSHINVSVDFNGNGTWDQFYYYEDPPFIGSETTYEHQFPDEGNFTCIVNMFNDVSNVTISCPEKHIIQYTIPELILFTTSPYKMISPNSNVTVFIRLDPSAAHAPTDPFCTWIYHSTASPKLTFAGPLHQNQTFNDTFNYEFTHVGSHTIIVNCTNYIQYVVEFTDIVIQEQVAGVNVSLSPLTFAPHFYFNTSVIVDFTVSCRNGSHAEANVTYGDGSTAAPRYMADPYPGFANSRTVTFRHRFSRPGNRTPVVVVNNSVSYDDYAFSPMLPLVIQDPVPNISATLDSYYLATPPGEVPFTITMPSGTEVRGPTDPWLTSTILNIGNLTLDPSTYFVKEEFDSAGELLSFAKTFTGKETIPAGRVGSGQWHMNLSNLVSFQYRTVAFQMEEVIEGLQVHTSKRVVRIEEEFTLNMKLSHGSHVHFLVDFEPGEERTNFTHPQPENSTAEVNISRVYGHGGNRTITVVAVNHVSNMTVSASEQQVVMAPLRELEFEIRNLNPRGKMPNKPGMVNFSVCIPPEDQENRVVWPHNVFMNWTFKDASTPTTRFFDFQSSGDGCFYFDHTIQNYDHGNLETKIECWNLVSNLSRTMYVPVVQITEAPIIQSSHTAQNTDSPVHYNCSCGEGSNITITINFGDNSPTQQHFFPGQIESAYVNFSHIYPTPGNYSPSCNFTNDVSTNITTLARPVTIQTAISEDKLELKPDSEFVAFPPGRVQWELSYATAPYPENVHLRKGEFYQYTDEFPYYFNSTYNFTDNSNMTFVISNQVSEVVVEERLKFQKVIENVTIQVDKYVAAGTNVTIRCLRNSGTHAHVNLTIDQIEKSTYQKDYMSQTIFLHEFEEPGMYTLSCKICNEVSPCEESSVSPVTALHAPTSLIFENKLIVEAGIETDITVRRHDDALAATEANMTIDFGDNSTIARKDLEDPFDSETIKHVFEREGEFIMTGRVINELGVAENTSGIEARWPIKNLTINVTKDSVELKNLKDLKKGLHVKAMVTYSNGSKVSVNWTLTQISPSQGPTVHLSTLESVDISFPEPGVFLLRVDADNEISQESAEREFTIKSPLTIASFLCPQAKSGFKVGETETCEVTLEDAVPKVCFKMSFSSNTTISVPPMIYGTSSEECHPDNEFTMINNSVPYKDFTFELNISSPIDPLYIKLTVHSQGSVANASQSTTVLLQRCGKPEVSVKPGEGDSIDRPKVYKKNGIGEGTDILIRQTFFNIYINCEAEHKVSDTWKTFRISNNKSEPIKEESGSTIAIGNDIAYGLYCVQFTRELHLVNAYYLHGFALYYFEISPSELVVEFDGNFRQVGKSNELVLESNVVDPDEEQVEFNYIWSCRKVYEDESLNSDEGCFDNSPVELTPETIDGNVQLEIDGPKLKVGSELSTTFQYEFTLHVSKGSRFKEAVITVQAVEGDPPSLELICDENCEDRVTHLEKYTTCPKCENCDDADFTWEFQCGSNVLEPTEKASIKNPDQKVKCQMIETKDCIHQCLTVRVSMQLEGFPKAIHGTELRVADEPHAGNCEVKPSEGEAFKTKFSIECYSWIDRSESEDPCGQESESRRRRSTQNSPGIKFQYFYKRSEDEEKATEITTSTPELPYGFEENDYEIIVIVHVKNKYGIQTDVTMTVKVTKPADEQAAIANAVGSFVPTGNPADDFASIAAIATVIGTSPGGGEEASEDDGELLAQLLNNMAEIVDSNTDPDTLMAMLTMVSAETKAKVAGVVTASQQTISLMLQISSNLDSLDEDARKEFGTTLLGTIGTEAADIVNVEPPPPPPPVDYDAIPDEEAEEEEEERRKQEEEQRKKDQIHVAGSMQNSTNNMVRSLSKTLIAGDKIVVGDRDLQVTVILQKLDSLGGSQITTSGSQVTLPNMNFSSSKNDSLVIFNIVFSNTNFYSWDKSSNQVNGGITSVGLTDSETGEDVPFGELEEPMQVGMDQEGGEDNLVDMANATIDLKTNLIYFYVPVVESATAYVMDVTILDLDTSEYLIFDVFVKFNTTNTPQGRVNNTKGSYDWNATLPDNYHNRQKRYAAHGAPSRSAWVMVIPERFVGPPGLSIGFLPRVRDDPTPLNKTPEFQVASALTRCRSWNHLDEAWTTESCKVDDERSTLTNTLCLCNKLNHDVKTFSGGITMPKVNTIDFSNIFANFASLLAANPTVMATLISITTLYILILVWVRQKDKKDMEKWGVTALVDNLPDCALFYKISVYTGLRQRAGTESKVCFILAGEKGDTGVRVLDDGHGKHFVRGSLRHFVMSVNQDLGPLNYIRVWHDNSGEGVLGSWFLDKVTIEDLQRKTRYFFLCSRWLAAEEQDGQVDLSLPVAGDEEIDGFDHIFFSSARRNLTDEHLWISVLSRPTRSNFTRCQRLTCCLTLLYTTMIASAMWYKGASEDEGQDQVIRIGPIILSIQGLIVSIFANLTVIPINILIVQLFRKSKPRYYVDTDAAKKAKEDRDTRQKYMDENFGEKEKKQIESEKSQKAEEKSKEKGGDGKEKEKKKKKKLFIFSRYPFPWWCIYIAWALSAISCAISAFFVLLYSLEWGKFVSEEWLSSLLFSFIQSVVVVQPIKVIAVAMILSCIFKKFKDEEEEDDVALAKLQDDEEPIDVTAPDLSTLTAPAPPSTRDLKSARDKAEKDKRMWNTLKEALVYLLFLLLVAFIAWGPRDGNMYGMTTSIKQQISGEYKKHGPHAVETVDYLSDSFRFWLWANTTVVDALYYTNKYNGDPTTRRDRKYVSDGVSFRVGPVRLRQLRIKPGGCSVTETMRPFLIECNVQYNILTEEDRNFTAGWFHAKENTTVNEESIDMAFRYFSMLDLNGFPLWGYLSTFGGGGYVADLGTSPRRARRALENLMKANWVDYYTRAVFLEFTVFNPNVNLFCHTSFLVEFPLTGGTLAMPKTQAFQVYSGVGGMGTAVLVAQIIYIFVMIYFIYREAKEFRQKGKMEYFSDPWNIYEVLVIIASVVCIAMFAMKEVFGRLVTKQLKENKGGYSSYLQLATYIELVDYTVGFIVFMANIKFLRLLRFNTHVRELGKTFRLAWKDLMYFGASFFIMFSGFTMSATLLFGNHVYDFADFIQTLQALYAIILGSVDFNSMRRAQPILGPIFFFVYLTLVFFILVNMFVTILTNAYTEVRLEAKKQEEEVLSFFFSRFKNAVGMAKPNKDIGAGYIEPADLLDRRIDSLNAWINQYYKNEAAAKKAAMKNIHAKPKEKPLEGEASSKKGGWASMFSF